MDTILTFIIKAYENGCLLWLVIGFCLGIGVGCIITIKSKKYKLMVEHENYDLELKRLKEKERQQFKKDMDNLTSEILKNGNYD